MPTEHHIVSKQLLIPLFITVFLVFIRWHLGMLPFHTIAELFSVFVGILMLVIAANTFKFTRNQFLLFLGCIYANVAILDTFHTFTMYGMSMSNLVHKQATIHFWVYARLYEALGLVIAPYFFNRRLSLKALLIISFSLTAILASLAIFVEQPIFLTPQGLTDLKVFSEYLIIWMLIIAAFNFIRYKIQLPKTVLLLLLSSVVLTIIAEFSFTIYQDVHSIPFVVGHICKFISFWLIYYAIIANTLIAPFSMMSRKISSFDAIPHSALVVAPNGEIIQYNQAAAKFTQLEDLSGQNHHQLFHDDTISEFDCPICQNIRLKQGLHNQLMPIKNKWLLVSISPVDVESNLQGCICCYTDMTQLKQVELALQAKDQNIRRLLDHADSIAITGIDEQFKIFYLNPAAEKLYESNNSELIGQSIIDSVIPKTDQSACLSALKQCFQQKIDLPSGEREIITTKGKLIPVYSNHVLINSSDDGLKLYCFDFNLTELKQAQAQKARDDAIMQSIFETMPDMFFLMDKQGTILQFHANDTSNLYLDPKHFLGQSMYRVLPTDIGELFKTAVSQLSSLNDIETIEYPLDVPSGIKHFEARLKLLPDNQNVVAIIRDITEQQEAKQTLKDSEQLYRQMFEDNRAIKLIIDPVDGHIVQANQAAIDFYGYGEQLQHMRISDIRIDAEQEVRAQMLVAEQKQKTIFQFKHKLASGEIRDVEVYSGPIKLGSKSLLYSIIQDVTEKNAAKWELIETEKRLQDLFNNTSSLIYIKDLKGKYIGINRPYEQLFNISEAEIRGKTDYDLFEKSIADAFRRNDALAIDSDIPIEKEETVTIDGQQHHYLSVKFALRNANNEIYGVCGISTDITKRKQVEAQILHQAHYDTLTNLPNRFLSLDRLEQMIAEAKRNNEIVAVLFLDLDDFKKVNDTMGHDIGDQLLQQAAERLTSIIRGNDTVGRLGGDEFIILLKDLNHSSYAQPVIDHLIRTFRKPFKIENRDLLMTLSIGVAIYPDNGTSASMLLRNADSAMYAAKKLGRNTFSYFTEEMNKNMSRRLAIEEHIHGALERGEFSVHYQPQIDVASKTIIGAEALVRWFNPSLKFVSPAEFIPIAEQSGLIIPLGQFVLTQALSLIKRWQAQHHSPLRIAVNLSPRQFRDPELVNFVKSALQNAEVPAKQLELEITEGVLLSGHSYIDNALNAFGELGVELSMDDFGTGYSSLSYLRKFPFTVLKIDRSFVDGLLTTNADRELVNASITLAHSLGLKVVAEGVEEQAQLAKLAELNCDFAQGYYMAKPMPENELLTFKLNI